MYKVKEVSDITGISIRMLHHYDKIGILIPNQKSEAGYRFYNDDDLERLHQILLFKELDFSLEQIKEILDNPEFDKHKALKKQKEILIEKQKRLENIINSVENSINNLERGKKMSKEVFKLFDESKIVEHQEKYKKEVEEKYSKSEAYKQSQEKTSKYNKNDWSNIMEDADRIYSSIANLMDRKPCDEEVQGLVKEWRYHISKNFYDCTPEIFRGLALMYIEDERFKNNIDKHKSGLAKYLSEAMKIYCDNLEK